MKNHLTLIIASLLLILCVVEKQASYKADKMLNVENMYNFPVKDNNFNPTADQNNIEVLSEQKSLYNLSPLFQFASVDTTFQSSYAKVASQHLLQISDNSEILNN
jgi:hypothetical protein